MSIGMYDAMAAERRDVPAIVPLRFWSDHVKADDKGNFTEVDFVEYAKKGTNGATTVDKVSRIEKHNQPVWAVIERPYQAWKKGQADPVDGTPLTAWPAVTKGQVDQLRLLNLLSVEDVAGMTDGDCDRVGMGARALRTKARAYMDAKAGPAVVAHEIAKRDAQIEALTATVAELTASVEALAADKPKRGRPRDAAAG